MSFRWNSTSPPAQPLVVVQNRTQDPLPIPFVTAPEVYIAALGPQLLRLAGRRSPGTITWEGGPKTLARHIGPTLRGAAAAVGRPTAAVQVPAALPVAVTDDVNTARRRSSTSSRGTGTCPRSAPCSTAWGSPGLRRPL
jgi:5,10-methylenetetrahydromethanopterin reductase